MLVSRLPLAHNSPKLLFRGAHSLKTVILASNRHSSPPLRIKSPSRRKAEAFSNSNPRSVIPKTTSSPELADLQREVKAWSRSLQTKHCLELLGLSPEDRRYLVRQFVFIGDLRGLDILSTTLRSHRNVGRALKSSVGPSPAHKAIMNQFLQWASTQPPRPTTTRLATSAISKPISFSPFHRLGIVARHLDYRDPASFYLSTRRRKRRIILHVGPTNSGKTHNALLALAKAKTGIYAGPLRLLAHEIYERLNKGFVTARDQSLSVPRVCNLLTGEEQRILDRDAPFASMTVEMANVHTQYDVAVLDEVQLMADPERGYAWTRVILGLRTNELHLCGEETAVDLVKELLAHTGDHIEVHRYERLTPLAVAKRSINSLENVQPGDCVVAFRRSDLFRLKFAIEGKTGLRCAMAYGGLPPEVRAEQAHLFNEEGSGYDVMVASDAIGMGLNLKIKRVVFSTVDKFDGHKRVPLSISQTKQIAGRAGRFGLHDAESTGLATTLEPRDLRTLDRAMKAPRDLLNVAYIEPDETSVDALSSLFPPKTSFREVMETISNWTIVRSPFALASKKHPSLQMAMDLVDKYWQKLSTWECLTLVRMPVNYRDPIQRTAANNMIKAHAAGKAVLIAEAVKDSLLMESLALVQGHNIGFQNQSNERRQLARQYMKEGHVHLHRLESLHRIITGYLWMSYRIPAVYSEQEGAFAMKHDIESQIDFYLATIAIEELKSGILPIDTPSLVEAEQPTDDGRAEVTTNL